MRTVTLDTLWKGMIHDLLPYIIQFHYPYEYSLIDWGRGFEFINLEIDQLTPTSPQMGRVADVLVKLYLIGGEEVFFLFHLEIQGYVDETIPKRVFQMLYRTEETYGICPEILVIYVDEKPDFKPTQYKHRVWETAIRVDFKTFKLLDNPPTTFMHLDNPYCMILELVYWAMKKMSPSEDVTMQIQLDLITRLILQNYPTNIIKSCIIFIKYYIIYENPKKWLNFESKINQIMGTSQIKGLAEMVKEEFAAQDALLKTELQKVKAEAEKTKAEAEKTKAKMEAGILQMLRNGISVDDIVNAFDMPKQQVLEIKKRI